MSCSEGVQAASYCYIVALSIDVDAPFLRPSELRTLVCAVRDATGQDEHVWIDWQVGLDVTTAAGVAYVAKQILGFANRDPAEARRRAGGYAYLLVGVAPGSLAGSNEVDPAALVDQVRPYVGDVIRWTPEQVVVEGVEALIIVVDPPRSGDPIHCLHKQLHNFPPGTVFVRHTGRTEPASVADMEMLQRRLLDRTPGLELSVTAQPSTIEPIPDFARFVNDWAAEQKPRLISRRSIPPGSAPASGRSDWAAAYERALAYEREEPDTRSENEYRSEIDKYLHDAEVAILARAFARFARHGPAQLNLVAHNATEVGLCAVRLHVHVSGEVRRLDADAAGNEPGMPPVPLPLGTPSRRSPQSPGADTGDVRPAPPFMAPRPGQGYTVRDSGSVDIDYVEFELRPGGSYVLPPVPLAVNEPPGVGLRVEWQATAANVNGRYSGAFSVAVTPSTFDLNGLIRTA